MRKRTTLALLLAASLLSGFTPPAITVEHRFTTPSYIESAEVTGLFVITIPKGWRVYAPGSPDEYHVLRFGPGGGFLSEVTFSYPEGKKVVDDGEVSLLYSGKVEIAYLARRKGAGQGVWRPTVVLQACSDEVCLPPEERTLTIDVPAIGAPGAS